MAEADGVGCVSTERAANRMCSRRRGFCHSGAAASPGPRPVDGHAGETGLARSRPSGRRRCGSGGGEELRPCRPIGVAVLPHRPGRGPRWAGRPDRPASLIQPVGSEANRHTPSLAGARPGQTRRASARPAGWRCPSVQVVSGPNSSTVSCDHRARRVCRAAASAAVKAAGSAPAAWRACSTCAALDPPHAPGIPAWPASAA